MSHIRQQIREAMVTRLKTITAFGNRVYPYRTKASLGLPDVEVTTGKDTVNPQNSVFGATGPIDCHELEILISIRSKATSDMDDVLDGHCVLVEKAIATDYTFGSKIHSIMPVSTETGISGELEKPTGIARMLYHATYRIARSDPETVK